MITAVEIGAATRNHYRRELFSEQKYSRKLRTWLNRSIALNVVLAVWVLLLYAR